MSCHEPLLLQDLLVVTQNISDITSIVMPQHNQAVRTRWWQGDGATIGLSIRNSLLGLFGNIAAAGGRLRHIFDRYCGF